MAVRENTGSMTFRNVHVMFLQGLVYFRTEGGFVSKFEAYHFLNPNFQLLDSVKQWFNMGGIRFGMEGGLFLTDYTTDTVDFRLSLGAHGYEFRLGHELAHELLRFLQNRDDTPT